MAVETPLMTNKHKMFVAEYLACFDSTRAALKAGYSAKSAQAQGCQLLRHPKIAAEIERRTTKRLEKLEITADHVLEELARMGFANIMDYVRINADGQADVDLSKMTREQAAAVQEIAVDTTGGSNDGERRLVLRTRFKLGDKRGSLELLGKHLRLFPTKIEGDFRHSYEKIPDEGLNERIDQLERDLGLAREIDEAGRVGIAAAGKSTPRLSAQD